MFRDTLGLMMPRVTLQILPEGLDVGENSIQAFEAPREAASNSMPRRKPRLLQWSSCSLICPANHAAVDTNIAILRSPRAILAN